MAAAVPAPVGPVDLDPQSKPALTPPPSEKIAQLDDGDSSGLSDLDEEDDGGEIEPDHYYEDGRIPVFKPTMDQFRSFKKFIGKIDKYGMKSGIVKVIPPKEWRDALPHLDEKVKSIKVKNPITQEFEGTQGTYVQKNIEKQRSYNLPQWRELSEASNHQPPARRGERRRNQEKPTRAAPRTTSVAATPSNAPSSARKRAPARPKKGGKAKASTTAEAAAFGDEDAKIGRPLTPTSPDTNETESHTPDAKQTTEDADTEDHEATPTKGRQPKSVSSRRIRNRREAAEYIDEAAFENFDYRISNQDEFTPERCAELEKSYWKSITYNSPMYGADMPGSLFDDSTKNWNVAKLENLLDILGQKIPGVNTAYLYLGMWKSTFAWHLEDVDLYSINYIHFGAPKQWYSISQDDARRFEAAMRNVWPVNAKACDQFLRHKTFLISPALLQSQYNIRVNRLVHHEGEFVITFPYGYHSGYNLGYNCAESVNFATEAWLGYGRIAKKCNCEADSVWVDVNEIERKLRGEETEYEETDDGFDEEDDTHATDLPTPPESVEGKFKSRSRKRRREEKDSKTSVKRIRVRIKVPAKEPCCLCPNDLPSEILLPTDNGQQAHKLCAIYTPETFIEATQGSEQIRNVAQIDKARLNLKCNFCRSKRGACFQCSYKKCTRAYHPTCAAAAGVLVDIGTVPVFGEDGKEYTDIGIDFRCRYHRPKRPKDVDIDSLETNDLVKRFAASLEPGDVLQMQYLKGEIFAGVVVENRTSEETLLVDILPRGDRVEVEHIYALAFDPADSQLPIPSPDAQPLPISATNKIKTQQTHPDKDDHPTEGSPFCDVDSGHVWSEFHTCPKFPHPCQEKVNLDKPERLWHYLGKTSTEAKAQFTEDPRLPRHNLKSNFLDTVKGEFSSRYVVSTATPYKKRRTYPSSNPKPQLTSAPAPPSAKSSSILAAHAISSSSRHVAGISPPLVPQTPPHVPPQAISTAALRNEKPYQYKPQIDGSYRVDSRALKSQKAFQQHANGKIGITSVSPPSQLDNISQSAPVWEANSIPLKLPSVKESLSQSSPRYQNESRLPIASTSTSGNGAIDLPNAALSVSGTQTATEGELQPASDSPDGSNPQLLKKHEITPPLILGSAQASIPVSSVSKPPLLSLWTMYPYFCHRAVKRPRGPYQSPYAEKGFSDDFLPMKSYARSCNPGAKALVSTEKTPQLESQAARDGQTRVPEVRYAVQNDFLSMGTERMEDLMSMEFGTIQGVSTDNRQADYGLVDEVLGS